ncbi:MAG: hypothetical protein LBH39_07935, partial [Clostridiales Family XIII bacterium]|nr:hypothetical protein [Clostridiales Family XIII bacterium]
MNILKNDGPAAGGGSGGKAHGRALAAGGAIGGKAHGRALAAGGGIGGKAHGRALAAGSANINKLGWTALSLILPAMILLTWLYVAGRGLVPALLLPEPRIVMEEFSRQLTAGTIIGDISISLMRILKGYGLAVLFGGGLGIVMGMSIPAERFFSLTFTSIRQIPMMAWVPLLVMWFGIGEASKVAVIFMAA